MARILVQTDDRRTVLDERDVSLADISDERRRARLVRRLGRAVKDSEAPLGGARRPRRLAAIVPATDYRDLFG